jgi:hypothetical protein
MLGACSLIGWRFEREHIGSATTPAAVKKLCVSSGRDASGNIAGRGGNVVLLHKRAVGEGRGQGTHIGGCVLASRRVLGPWARDDCS